MRYLRHPQLFAWLVILALTATLFSAAAARGDQSIRSGQITDLLGAPTPRYSAAKAHVEHLRTLMQPGLAAGVDAAGLDSWASEVSVVAAAGAKVRTAEGAKAGDELRDGLRGLESDAVRMQQDSGDPVAAQSLRTHMFLRIDRLSLLVAGRSVPALPRQAEDPLGEYDLPTAPAAPTPSLAPLPTLEESR